MFPELAPQSELLTELNRGEGLFVIAIVTIAAAAAVIITSLTVTRSILISKAREQTKREVAAYVAEGTISPKDAVTIIEAGKSFDAEKLATAMSGRGAWVGCCGPKAA